MHTGEKWHEEVKLSVINYDGGNFQEKVISSIEEVFSFRRDPSVTWLNVDGVHQPEIIEQVGKSFGLHPLVAEDIASTGQRPKMEDFGDYIFVVLSMLMFDEKDNETKTEQVSILFGRDFVVSFQERADGDVFDPIRECLRSNKGKIRKLGADYLAYSLIDAVVDNYFVILEKLGETIEEVEEKVVTNPTSETLQTIHELKREMIFLRKSVWPLRSYQQARKVRIRINQPVHLRLYAGCL